jgi:PHP domain
LPKSNPLSGRYLFHLHTRCTDGKLSLENYFSFAAAHGIERLVFLEHIRSEPTYDVQQFALDVARISRERNIEAVLGFEVKLLPDGSLDIRAEHLLLASVIGIAEHGFPRDPHLLRSSLTRAFDHYSSFGPEKTFVWVHPGTTFCKMGVHPHEHPVYESIVRWSADAGLLIEQNLRYGLISDQAIRKSGLRRIILGADAHTGADLEAWVHATRSASIGAHSLPI